LLLPADHITIHAGKDIQMHIKVLSACALIVLMASISSAGRAAAPGVKIQSVKGQYEDVKERVIFAIENRGIVLNYTAHVGNMLERTGKDLGRQQRIFNQAEVIEFCSAALSRETMEADPHNIVSCPYTIAIYTLPQEPGKVYLSYREPTAAGVRPSAKALAAVEKLLEDIVREALR
jgi:uncharacterized protein (DUF302 family)